MNPVSILQLIGLIIGVGETVIPIFIHNPQTQQVEGVVITTLNGILAEFGAALQPPAVQANPNQAIQNQANQANLATSLNKPMVSGSPNVGIQGLGGLKP